MQSHITAVHEKKKPHHCSLCTQQFATKGNLESHIKTVHEGRKPFKCNICDYATSKKSNLKNHESIHDKGAIEILFQMKMSRNQIDENFDVDDESSDSEVP